jgi:hypothetical protein
MRGTTSGASECGRLLMTTSGHNGSDHLGLP